MLDSFGVSDPGCVRSNNEDFFLLVPSAGLYLVADGMGGAQAGEHASRLAAEAVRDVIEGVPQPASPDDLLDAFAEANRRVAREAEADPDREGMGTTLVAAVEHEDDLFIASVGDSRAYLFEKGELKPVTEDQTWVNEVGRRLGLDENTLRIHPMRHVLTMAIGVSGQLRVHHYRVHPEPGSLVLLCSDGLHGVAPDVEIAKILATDASLESMGKNLIALARSRGGPDNITAVLLRTTTQEKIG
jgi:serine/threonine protein phosphatase PrpC